MDNGRKVSEYTGGYVDEFVDEWIMDGWLVYVWMDGFVNEWTVGLWTEASECESGYIVDGWSMDM